MGRRMAKVKVTINLGNYRALRARINNPSAALPLVDRAVRQVVGAQFAAGGPGWEARKEFGAKPGGVAFEGSKLRAAWSTPGAPGAVARATDNGFEIGIDRTMFSWDDAHQKGALIKARQFVATKAGGPLAKMGMALRHQFGVNISEAKLKSGLVLPARPHARKSPAIVKAIKAALVGYFKGRD